MNIMKYLAAILVLFFSVPAGAENFKGYPCTKDCSGHEAGYEWAQRKGIADYADCRGNSQSFVEGCRAAVDEFNPAAIAPAAGDGADPDVATDPFNSNPFYKDPFAPEALPGGFTD